MPISSSRVIGLWRAIGTCFPGRRIKKASAISKKVGTGCSPLAVRKHSNARPIDIHFVYLIAASAVACGLKDKLASVVGEVCFRILTPEAQLPNISKALFIGTQSHQKRLRTVRGATRYQTSIKPCRVLYTSNSSIAGTPEFHRDFAENAGA